MTIFVAYRSTNIWRFLRVNFPDVPAQCFSDRVEGVLALRGGEGAVQHALRHRDLQLNIFKLSGSEREREKTN